MNQTWYERDVAESRKKGILELLEVQLVEKFGSLPEPAKEQLLALSEDALRRFGLALLDANSLEELGLTG